MKKTFLLLTAIFLMGTMSMKAQSSLYIYSTNGTKQTFAVEEVMELTFTGTDLVVNKVVGVPVSIAFSDLNYFSLKDKGTDLGMTPRMATTVSVVSNNGIVTVKSNQTIAGVNIFDLQGRRVVQLCPYSQEANISLADYSDGVYLVQIVNETGIITKKIIKN